MLAVILALVSFTFYGVALALMKYGAEALANPKLALTSEYHRNRMIVWLLGVVANVSHGAVLMAALGFGSVSIVAPFTGWGLAVLAILSHFFLEEPITRRELQGIGIIIVGTIVLGFLSEAPPENLEFSGWAFFIFSVILLLWCLGSMGYTLLGNNAKAAWIFALAAGIVGGVSTLCQRVFTSSVVEGASVWSLLSDPYFLFFLIVTNASFALLQVANQYGTVIVVAPVFTAALILTPVAGGVLVFLESWNLFQAAGILLVMAGMVTLTANPGKGSRGSGNAPKATA